MSCTTVLVGKNASNDRSTMIARTDDGWFDVKKLKVTVPEDQPRKYKSVKTKVEIELPDDPLRYTSCPNVDPSEGVWPASGINSANVGMTATETITTNPRVLAADPKVTSVPGPEGSVPAGIGEEDMVLLVLPYIRSAREGVKRLGELLERYGTYESNGIAFNDADEIWWLETIGGHHWIASRVPDDMCVINPNQFGTDSFDMEDAFGKQEHCMCSADLREFIADNFLDLNQDGRFDPRDIFGSRGDLDHVYNTPRAWFMGRYLAPDSFRWDGANAEFTPESDRLPWAIKPDRKVTVEDVAYLLSSHYQGTEFDPYSKREGGKPGKYRPVGINRTGVTAICQIREGVPEEIRGIEWIAFGPTVFSAFMPVYTNTAAVPDYLGAVEMKVSTENFYWSSRLLGALADRVFPGTLNVIDRYKAGMFAKGRELVGKYDRLMKESGDFSLTAEANEEICKEGRQLTEKVLGEILHESSFRMKCGFSLSDG